MRRLAFQTNGWRENQRLAFNTDGWPSTPTVGLEKQRLTSKTNGWLFKTNVKRPVGTK